MRFDVFSGELEGFGEDFVGEAVDGHASHFFVFVRDEVQDTVNFDTELAGCFPVCVCACVCVCVYSRVRQCG